MGLKEVPGRPRGESWALCEQHRAFIQGHLKNRIRLTKIGKLLKRNGVAVTSAALYRFAVAELGFGKPPVTVPVADCGPGGELQEFYGGVFKVLIPDNTPAIVTLSCCLRTHL